MFYDSWPCDRMKSKAHNHGSILNSHWVSWWTRVMNSLVRNDSLDSRFIITACMTPTGLGISALELEDNKFGLEGQTKDGRSESSMSKNCHGLLFVMNETL